MSGVVKSVKKVFKKITKSKLGQFVVGAAVSYFTAGLGSAVLGAMGASLSPVMTTVLSHAISGAATGGIMAAASGGNIGKGLLMGGAGGAIMGGVQSALNFTPVPGPAPVKIGPVGSSGLSSGQAATLGIGQQAIGAGATTAAGAGGSLTSGVGLAAKSGTGFINVSAPGATPSHYVGYGVNSNTIPAGTTAMTPAGMVSGTGKTGVMGWVERNPDIVGSVASGAVRGGLEMAGAGDGGNDIEAAKRAQIEADEKAQAAQIASHSVSGGLLQPGTASQPTNPTPPQRWDTPGLGRNGKWVYQGGKVVFVNPTG